MAPQRLTFAIPLVAILIIGLLLYVSYTSSLVALSLRSSIVIEIVRANPETQQFEAQFVIPLPNIGQPGGKVATTKYLQDGVRGFYPIYTDTSCAELCTINVESKVVREYTLGDFFEVWGEPLGPDVTLAWASNTTSTGQTDFYWGMCVRDPGQQFEYPTEEWGTHVLRDGERIHLIYSQIGCA